MTSDAQPQLHSAILTFGAALGSLLIGGIILAAVSSVSMPIAALAAANTVLVFGVGGLILNAGAKLPRLGTASPRAFLSAASLGVGLALLASFVLVITTTLVPPSESWLNNQSWLFEELLRPGDLAWIPVTLLIVGFLPGFFEEFFFRGVLLSRLKDHSASFSVVAVAILFTAVHMDPWSAPALFGVALALGYFAVRCGGWLAPAVAHTSLNAFNSVVWPRLSLDELPTHMQILSLVIITAIGLSLIFVAWRMLPIATEHDN